MTEERTLATERVYQGRLVNLRIDSVELSTSRRTTREIVEHGDCVAIVALDAEDNVLLVRQYRKPIERALLEIPAGLIEPNEQPEDCVRRELQEETGYLPQSIEKLGGFYSSPGFCTEFLHLYLATDLVPSRLSADTDESIELVRLPLSQTPQLIASGEICDAKSIAGLLTVIFRHQ